MFVLIVGIGRVGSSLARTMLDEGHEVSCLDEDPDALALLEAVMGGSDWVSAGGRFTVGQGLELDALTAAGIERAHAFVCLLYTSDAADE